MIRRWFLAGLLVWIPLGATLLVIRFLLGLFDTSLLLLPPSLRPDIPGLGALLSVALVLGTGALAANFLGSKLLDWIEYLFEHIPLVRSFYGGMKKLAESLFSDKGTSFRKVVLIEWPRPGQWSIGFQAGEPLRQVSQITGEDMITVFVPTTPNPTSGFLMQVRKRDAQVLDMSVEEGMRYVISLGVVPPNPGSRPSSMVPAVPAE
ncbi:MAG: rane protein [Nevskia sp.]|nr:rane protein [Nevskia sp.]